MKLDFDYGLAKDALLKKTRGIGFEKIIEAVNTGGLIADIKHFNQIRYPNQRILVVKVKNYVYAVPYITDLKRKVKFLKTIYANRKMAKKYLK